MAEPAALALRVRVRGRVQGVGFHAWAARQAAGQITPP